MQTLITKEDVGKTVYSPHLGFGIIEKFEEWNKQRPVIVCFDHDNVRRSYHTNRCYDENNEYARFLATNIVVRRL